VGAAPGDRAVGLALLAAEDARRLTGTYGVLARYASRSCSSRTTAWRATVSQIHEGERNDETT
jgi:hypothetical protein